MQATLEVLATEKTPPADDLAPMHVAAGDAPEVAVLHGVLNTAPLPPGRYFARATVVQDGKAQGHIVRPFRVVAANGGG